ncbi:DUF433 domain-containing protein [Rhodopila sp.]|uniref:DUF433 domain-containing protein n=1 Tax=Rhodopila sp. TaxID=2480087 RepID=UPI003D1000A8
MSFIETIPGKVSGVPLVKGTRVPVQAVVDNAEAGVSPAEIAGLFDVPVETVTAVIRQVREQRGPRPD